MAINHNNVVASEQKTMPFCPPFPPDSTVSFSFRTRTPIHINKIEMDSVRCSGGPTGWLLARLLDMRYIFQNARYKKKKKRQIGWHRVKSGKKNILYALCLPLRLPSSRILSSRFKR